MPRTQAERSHATTGELVEAAHELFAASGYAQTSIEDIVRAAGVTRGALYHHFASKLDVFRAVFEREERELTRMLAVEAAGATDPWERVKAGCHAFLNACLTPSVQRITLLDGPSVLGWEAVREIESRHALALLREGLQAAADAGFLTADDVETLAHLLFGALCEGGMLIARAKQPNRALARVLAQVDRLLEGGR